MDLEKCPFCGEQFTEDQLPGLVQKIPSPTPIEYVYAFVCPACGAQAEWDPARQMLRCPFCGTQSPYQVDRETAEAEAQARQHAALGEDNEFFRRKLGPATAT